MKRLREKIKSSKNLVKVLPRRKKVVFTNGCFDVIHPGHVLYLERAKALGDILIVALNDDSSVKRLKGPSRPINPLADRLKVVAALASVDYVTWFSEDTPLKTILQLTPHILVKGGDWKTSEIVGSQEVKSWKGKVKRIPFVSGKSSTSIIRRMNHL